MPTNAKDRPISASEVERWSYCPLSWKLDRSEPPVRDHRFAIGDRVHADHAEKASKVIKDQERAMDARKTTWSFILISGILLLLGVSLAFLTRVGFMNIDAWRLVVVSASILLVSAGLFLYFRRSAKEGSIIKTLMSGRDLREIRGRVGFTLEPFLLFAFGSYLLINGILMLQPFGLSLASLASFMTISLVVIYFFLLMFFIIYLRDPQRGPFKGRISMTALLMVGLLIFITVLFLFISEMYEMGDTAGFIILIASFIWFIGSLVFHLYRQNRRGPKSARTGSSADLPMVVLSIIASMFAASAFMATSERVGDYYVISVALSILWLLGAAFFMFRATTLKRGVEDGLEDMGIARTSRLIGSDPVVRGKRGRPLMSKRHYLIGTPDLIIEEDGKKIPVEIKSGRVPKSPHFSHIMQLTCYMILMDVEYGSSPPYGYVDYRPPGEETKRFQVDLDLLTRAIALSKVSEIRDSIRTGEAHRNHDNPGKCRNCSRRGLCPERLV
ncbi:MAG: Dna2/Cas4 domain-containing protein [Candidatus Thermoplasmatota archaeon]|nr:Dna2/Cas4 domain-containing protein [Candidatus Thermoplasmatota archaeon]